MLPHTLFISVGGVSELLLNQLVGTGKQEAAISLNIISCMRIYPIRLPLSFSSSSSPPAAAAAVFVCDAGPVELKSSVCLLRQYEAAER